jgi:two-component system sensor histidine kinase and response regulator WspE
VTGDPGDTSLWSLYRGEVDAHARVLNDGLLALERQPADLVHVPSLMRAAHSLKGAARIVRHQVVSDLAHAVEDRLVAAQRGRAPLTRAVVARLLEAVDLIGRVSPEAEDQRDALVAEHEAIVRQLVDQLREQPAMDAQAPPDPAAGIAATLPTVPAASETATASDPPREGGDDAVRVTARRLTNLLNLASEAMVRMRGLSPVVIRLAGLKRVMADVAAGVARLAEDDARDARGDRRDAIVRLQRALEGSRAQLADIASTLDAFSLRQETLSDRLYHEIVATRMRPFSDLADSFPRAVRDLARDLGKRVDLVVEGRETPVDRDVAGVLERSLIHAIRNALDHGIEPPGERLARGKPETGTLRLSAWHRAGLLQVEVADDGAGVDLPALRARLVERGLVDRSMADRLSEQELLAFLFLPGFTTSSAVSDVSGRGVGLDVVAGAVNEVGGRVQIRNQDEGGVILRLELPATLSVTRALVVEVAGEPLAIPLTRVARVAVVARDEIRTLEGRSYAAVSWPATGPEDARRRPEPEHRIALVSARQILGLDGEDARAATVPLVILRDDDVYGVQVDGLVGDRAIVVRPLDPRLGKVRDIGAAALMSDGTPLFVVDVDDMLRTIRRLLEGGRATRVDEATPATPAAVTLRVLVVDDSITVRELQRQLLESHGYEVDVAVDGIDGWNTVQLGGYDLVVTDIDMPRMDGIELVRRIRADRRLEALPVLVVSYKDRDTDRQLGLEAGASHYLPKASFKDDTFLATVDELIGGGRTR